MRNEKNSKSKVIRSEMSTDYITHKVQVLELIKQNYPDLIEKAKSAKLEGNELTLIAFMKADLTLSEKAKLLDVNKNSIRMIRMRIRKKLGIDYRVQIIEFLEKDYQV